MKSEYVEGLRAKIEQRHSCKAVHSASCPVHESINGSGVWKGNVETFLLIGSIEANRCFAWLHESDGSTPDDRVVTILEIPPIDTPTAAVRASKASIALSA